ncbi:MAG TPA: hypothetical protein GXZ87_00970, partial [Bacteroidales bacterium]|nr:hypothetical protein [Bacteroidales bacterium]
TKDYTEFSVDVVSAANDYFNTKSTIKNIPLNTYKDVEGDYPKMNNVNLNSINQPDLILGSSVIRFKESKWGSVIYDDDLSLSDGDGENSMVIYKSLTEGGSYINVIADGLITVSVYTPVYAEPQGEVTFEISGVYTSTKWVEENSQTITFKIKKDIFITLAKNAEIRANVIVRYLAQGAWAQMEKSKIDITIKKKTAIKYSKRPLNSIALNEVYANLLGNINYIDAPADAFITSDKEVVTNTGYLSVVPKDFIRETSTMLGLVFNFGSTETKIEKVNTYFDRIEANNRIIIENYKDLVISNFETIYNSCTIGVEKYATKNIVHYEPYQTKLSYKRFNYNDEYVDSIGENMELVCTKLSADVEKIINRINDATTGNGQTSNDNFYFVPNRIGDYPDYQTPAEMADNHKAILALFFATGELDDLEDATFLAAYDDDGLSSSESAIYYNLVGDPDFFNNKRLRPIVYEFTALLGEADFSEHMAQIVDFNGETVDLFVYSSETTDKLSEIKCKALVYK